MEENERLGELLRIKDVIRLINEVGRVLKKKMMIEKSEIFDVMRGKENWFRF